MTEETRHGARRPSLSEEALDAQIRRKCAEEIQAVPARCLRQGFRDDVMT